MTNYSQANIVQRDPREASMVKIERYQTSELNYSGRTLRNGMERSAFAKAFLKIIGVLGVSLVMSDGVLTPAQVRWEPSLDRKMPMD